MLKWVEDGEEVQVLRRNRVVAIVVPPNKRGRRQPMPDFEKRSIEIWGRRPAGKPASRVLIDDRDERL